MRVLLLLVAAAATGTGTSAYYPTPPVFKVSAQTTFGAGFEHGRVAASRIQGWFETCEMQAIFNYSTGIGRDAFLGIKSDSARLYPQFDEELAGIAAGAGVPVDHVYGLNMIEALENQPDFVKGDCAGATPHDFTPPSLVGHCTDVYARSDSGEAYLGHNEDWAEGVMPFWYFMETTPGLASTPVSRAHDAAGNFSFSGCAGMVYPGGLLAWTVNWGARSGLVSTQNTLFANNPGRRGVMSSFAQKHAFCETDGLEAAVAALGEHEWADGASLNILDARSSEMVNVEVHRGLASVYRVARNYSHMNMYKHVNMTHLGRPEASTVHRQARLDSLPPPRSFQDVVSRLSDQGDPILPIYRNFTLSSMVYDATARVVSFWCCGHKPSDGPSAIAHTWDLTKWFDL